jgi:N6-L-threonylcarbamoyladenine synthase
MIHSNDLDFSFSGLKTAVLYTTRDLKTELSDEIKSEIAREFEDAVVDVLLSKTEKALLESGAQSLIIAGGVVANTKIREAFSKLISEKYPDVSLFIPDHALATDNAVMIAMASYIETLVHPEILTNGHEIIAQGNLKF